MVVESAHLLSHYQHIMESAGYVIFTTASNGKFFTVSSAVTKLTGYEESEVIGKHFTELIDPSWREKMVDLFVMQVKQKQTEARYEFPIITKSGERRWVEQTVILLENQPEQMFQAICQDITERKREQMQYQALFDQNNDAIFIMNLEGRHIAVNQRAAEIFGYPREEIVNKPYDMLVAVGEFPKSAERLKQLLNGEQLPIYERIFRRKDGTEFPCEVNVQLVKDDADNPLHIQSIVRDISDRKHVEQQLRNRETLYRTLARNLPNSAILLYDHDLRYLIAEGDALEDSGYVTANMEGKTIHEVLPEETAKRLEPLYRQALQGETLSFELPSRGRIFAAQMLPIYDGRGAIFAGMIVSQDITEEKRNKEALLASEARNRAILRAIPDLIFVLDKQGDYVDFDWSDSEANVFPKSDVKMNVTDFGFDEPTLELTLENLERALKTGAVQKYVYEPLMNDAEDLVGAFEARVAALNDDEAIFIIRDISDLKIVQSELSERIEQLTILHQFDEEIADRLDIDYVLNMAMDASIRLSQADSGYIALKDTDGTFQIAKVAGDHSVSVANANLKSQKGAVSRIVRNQSAELISDVSLDPDYIVNRSKTKAQITVSLLSQSHDIIGVLNLETDRFGVFTEEIFSFVKLVARRITVAIDNAYLYQQVEGQLAQLQVLYDQISNLEQLKTDMIRIASHDLRNPLSTVLGYAEMSTYEVADQEGDLKDYIDMIYQSARKMQKIIIDILSLERIQEMAEQTEPYDFYINDLVQAIYADYESEARMRGKILTVSLPEQRIEVLGDLVQIREAITNLVTNGIKYTRDNGKIEMRLFVPEDGKKDIIVEVRDNGFGIREDLQERLFQPFYRARTAETADIEGTGLGLHLVKNIVERHGGKMSFESVHGKGSTFGFSLPIKHIK
ncbi:MAG: PAS domain S-box protein [Aggregatilineales bacterium]